MRKIQVLSGLAVLAAAMTAGPSAQAGFGSWGGSHGSSGGASYGSSGGSSGGFASHGSSGGSSGSYGSSGGFASSGGSSGVAHVGPIRRLIGHLHQHHAAKVARRAAFHSSGGSYGSGGSSGGYVSYGSSGGSSYGSSGHVASPVIYGGGGSSGGHYSSHSNAQYHDVPVYSYSNPVEPTQYAVAETSATVDNDTAILTVSVPESAVVRVNGMPTKSAGSIRQFMSSGLEAGFVYKYEIEVQYEGVESPETHTVKLRAGSAERVVFNGPSTASNVAVESVESPEAPETVVTIHVPADAKVELAGNETKGEGETRTFRTRRLAAGEAWESYTIRVTANINGSAVTKEKTMRLEAGSVHDLAFEFDVTEVASR